MPRPCAYAAVISDAFIIANTHHVALHSQIRAIASAMFMSSTLLDSLSNSTLTTRSPDDSLRREHTSLALKIHQISITRLAVSQLSESIAVSVVDSAVGT